LAPGTGEELAVAQSSLMRAGRPWATCIGLALAAVAAIGAAAAAGETTRMGLTRGAAGLDEAGSLLGEYFRRLLADGDMEAFRDRVESRYGEPALCRLVSDCPGPTTRRAAVVALGALGTFPRSNPVLGHALRDPDPVVRRLAEDAMWSLWFRADTPENNLALMDVSRAVGRGDLERADALASRLIVASPRFAEAYNQRAIIAFQQGRFADSARDCGRVLELNPYHFGAMSGLAQCQLQLDQPAQAIETLRRVSRLQPHNTGIKELIRRISARMALDASR
jgi:tetratricopeptide (TPR) repeat protein